MIFWEHTDGSVPLDDSFKGQQGMRGRQPVKFVERYGGYGVADQAALAGSGFAITLVVARSGGPDELGIFVLFQSASLFLNGLVKAGIGDALVVQPSNDRGSYLDTLSVLVTGVVALGLLLAIGAWAARFVFAFPAEWILLSALVPISGFYEVARSYRLAAVGERGLFMGDLWVAGMRLISLASVVIGLEGAAVGVVALTLGSLVSLLSLRSFFVKRFDVAGLISLWSTGRWFAGESLLFGLGAYGFWFLAVPRAGASIAGQLRAIQQLFAPLQAVTVGLGVVLLARLSREKGRLRGRARPLARLQVLIIGVWSVVVVAVGPQGVSAIFGGSFEVTRVELVVFSVATLLATCYAIAALQLRARRLGGGLIKARATATVVSLSAVLAFGTSIVGVAWANTAGQLGGLGVACGQLSGDRLKTDRGDAPSSSEIEGSQDSCG